MDMQILQTLSVLFSGILSTSELLSLVWEVCIFCCKNGILLSL